MYVIFRKVNGDWGGGAGGCLHTPFTTIGRGKGGCKGAVSSVGGIVGGGGGVVINYSSGDTYSLDMATRPSLGLEIGVYAPF